MSFELQDWAIDLVIPCGKHSPFTSNDKLLLIFMCRLENEDGYSWPSQSYLARKTGMCRPTINRRLLEWEGLDLIHSREGWIGPSGYAGKQYIIQKQAWIECIKDLNRGEASNDTSVLTGHNVTEERDVTIDDRGVLPTVTYPSNEELHNKLEYNLTEKPNKDIVAGEDKNGQSPLPRQRILNANEMAYVRRLADDYFDYYRNTDDKRSYHDYEQLLTAFMAGEDRSETAWQRLAPELLSPQELVRQLAKG